MVGHDLRVEGARRAGVAVVGVLQAGGARGADLAVVGQALRAVCPGGAVLRYFLVLRTPL